MKINLPKILLGALVVTSPFWPLQNVAQQVQSNSSRKILSKLEIVYPPLARNLGLKGRVRVVVVVAPDGTVVRSEIIGGSPVFIPTVVKAVKEWKWISGPRETHELLEISFKPN